MSFGTSFLLGTCSLFLSSLLKSIWVLSEQIIVSTHGWIQTGATKSLILSFHPRTITLSNLKTSSRQGHIWLVAVILCHYYWSANYPAIVHSKGKRKSKRMGKEPAIRQVSL